MPRLTSSLGTQRKKRCRSASPGARLSKSLKTGEPLETSESTTKTVRGQKSKETATHSKGRPSSTKRGQNHATTSKRLPATRQGKSRSKKPLAMKSEKGELDKELCDSDEGSYAAVPEWAVTPEKEGLPGHTVPSSQTHDHHQELAPTHTLLEMFDLEMKYGPCVGITRWERWNRAESLGLAPPENIFELLKQADRAQNASLLEGRL